MNDMDSRSPEQRERENRYRLLREAEEGRQPPLTAKQRRNRSHIEDWPDTDG